MHGNKEENVVFVLQKTIKQFKIKVTNTTIKEFLLAHPHYPSLKSVCDALKKWRIEHYPLNLEIEEIKELEMPFIAHLKLSGGQLVFVEKTENEKVTYVASEGKSITEEFEKFSEKLSGAVVVMEGGKNSGEQGYIQIRQNEVLNNSLLQLGILTVLVLAILNFISSSGYSFFQSGYIFWGLLITKLIGLVASIFLVLYELKVHTPITDKICGFSSKTDCDTVLSSNASKLFGWVNWADAGLIYFIGTFIYLLASFENPSISILAIMSALSLPYPVFSVYYQSVKLKKWCPFCIIVQVVLITEFLLLIPAFKSITFSGIYMLRLIATFLVPVSIWLILKAYYNKSGELSKEHYSFLQFKRNPDIFRFLLKSNGYTKFSETRNGLVFGNPEAPVTITAFLSLYCHPCASAFKKLKTLLGNCPDVKINVAFSVNSDEETQKVIDLLYYLYKEKSAEASLNFLEQWYSIPKQLRKTLYSNEIILDQFYIAQQINDENKKLFEKHKVAGTPTVYINGYKFPNQYEYNDIEYNIDELKKLNGESIRQEACSNSN